MVILAGNAGRAIVAGNVGRGGTAQLANVSAASMATYAGEALDSQHATQGAGGGETSRTASSASFHTCKSE